MFIFLQDMAQWAKECSEHLCFVRDPRESSSALRTKLGEFLVTLDQHPEQDLSDYTCSVARKYYSLNAKHSRGLVETNGLSCIMN